MGDVATAHGYRDAGESLLPDEPKADHPLSAPTKPEDVPKWWPFSEVGAEGS